MPIKMGQLYRSHYLFQEHRSGFSSADQNYRLRYLVKRNISPDWSNLMVYFVFVYCLIGLQACRACLRDFSFKAISWLGLLCLCSFYEGCFLLPKRSIMNQDLVFI